jgi:hypothetical protein
VSVPDDIRSEVLERLAKAADEAGWLSLAAATKSRYYTNWASDPTIGGRLARFLDADRVRLYIKDALMKPYTRARRADMPAIFTQLEIPKDVSVTRSFIKPHGCLLADGRVICWGRSNTWKLVLMAVYERAYDAKGATPHAAVLTQSAFHFGDDTSRAVVHAAANKLGIATLAWRMD